MQDLRVEADSPVLYKGKAFIIIKFIRDYLDLGFKENDAEEIPAGWLDESSSDSNLIIRYPNCLEQKELSKLKEKSAQENGRPKLLGLSYLELTSDSVIIIGTASSRISAVTKIKAYENSAKPINRTSEEEALPRFRRPPPSLTKDMVVGKGSTRKRKASSRDETPENEPRGHGAGVGIGNVRVSPTQEKPAEDCRGEGRELTSNGDVAAVVQELRSLRQEVSRTKDQVKFLGAQVDVLVKQNAEMSVDMKSHQKISAKTLQMVSTNLRSGGGLSKNTVLTRQQLRELGVNLPIGSLNELEKVSRSLAEKPRLEDQVSQFLQANLSGEGVRSVSTTALRHLLTDDLMASLVLKHAKKIREEDILKTPFSKYKLYQTTREAILSHCRQENLKANPRMVDVALSARLSKEGANKRKKTDQSEGKEQPGESRNPSNDDTESDDETVGEGGNGLTPGQPQIQTETTASAIEQDVQLPASDLEASFLCESSGVEEEG